MKDRHTNSPSQKCYSSGDKVCVHKRLGGAGGSDSFRQDTEDSFTGRDNKAGFRSQGRALPGQEDQARNHPGEVGARLVCLRHTQRLAAGSGFPGDAIGMLRKMDLVRKCLCSATIS